MGAWVETSIGKGTSDAWRAWDYKLGDFTIKLTRSPMPRSRPQLAARAERLKRIQRHLRLVSDGDENSGEDYGLSVSRDDFAEPEVIVRVNERFHAASLEAAQAASLARVADWLEARVALYARVSEAIQDEFTKTLPVERLMP